MSYQYYNINIYKNKYISVSEVKTKIVFCIHINLLFNVYAINF